MDWKIIAALIVAVAIVVSGFAASGGINFTGTAAAQPAPAQNPPAGANPLGDFLSGAKDAVANILTGTAPEKNVNRTLQVSASLSMEDSLLKLNAPASSVEIEFNAPASMNVGSEIIQLSGGAIIFIGNFSGRLDIYANNTVLIDGNAETIFVSNVGILPHEQKTVSVKAATFAKSVEIYNTSADSLDFNATGSLSAALGKVAIKLYNEPLRIQNFRGNMRVSGTSLVLDGFSTNILAAGGEK
ncbi:MAG: hypothetical protein KKB25_02695, partial [Nanoarchaeota archaeon]|nr:hypothetical protein [Nanoarchaeota archaeon]